jgi:NCAIR mutase (PurE)-related protein
MPRPSPASLQPGFADLDFAKVDLDRRRRCGASEVVYGPGKTAPQIIKIARTLRAAAQPVLITRLDPAKARRVRDALRGLRYDPQSRMGWIGAHPPLPSFRVGLCAAGTSDLPVAEEAARACAFFGLETVRFTDIGVAGIHRLLAQQDGLRACHALIVVAGMEAALPSVIGGLVDIPVIAVPTSVGYGWHMEGLTALLGMLNSCASGLAVVNIDNGFGAAYAALRVARASSR